MPSTRTMRVNEEIDKYLNSLPYRYVTNTRLDRLHSVMCESIGKIVMRHYENIDITNNFELSVCTNTIGGEILVTVTGYVKISEGYYLPIEKTYKKE
jgi:hypothetical protein